MENITKVAMVSLGCAKNQVDAELMLSKIAEAGFGLVPEPGLADIVVVNTCGFIQSAKEEAIEWIMELITLKNEGTIKHIIVTGCLAERYRQQFVEEFPEVDGVLGIAKNNDIVEAINTVLLDKKISAFGVKEEHDMEGKRMVSTLPHYAYLRVADGCDNRCSYCAIPLIRGRFRSRKIEALIEEAKELVKNGARELIVIAQDTTRYGEDLYGKLMLPELINKLCEIEDLKWLRLMYCYPERVTDELIQTMKNQPKVVKYLDIPIQHCNGDLLKRMNRRGNEESLRELFAKLRREIPDITLRTTLITGFPGETDEQFTQLAEFVNDIRFERLGCFAYSEEEDTPAASFPDQVDEELREHRKEIIEEQQDIRVSELYNGFIGKETEVVCEGYDKYLEHYFGRSAMFAPEIDGMIYFKSAEKLHIGDFVNIRFTDVMDNNLIGEKL